MTQSLTVQSAIKDLIQAQLGATDSEVKVQMAAAASTLLGYEDLDAAIYALSTKTLTDAKNSVNQAETAINTAVNVLKAVSPDYLLATDGQTLEMGRKYIATGLRTLNMPSPPSEEGKAFIDIQVGSPVMLQASKPILYIPTLDAPLGNTMPLQHGSYRFFWRAGEWQRTEMNTFEMIRAGGRTAKTVKTVTTSEDWTVPSGVTHVLIDAVAGGGGGGGAYWYNSGGGGGGGGAAVKRACVALTPGETIALTVGAGGSRGHDSNRGGTGGTTKFGDLIEVVGGIGGHYSTNIAQLSGRPGSGGNVRLNLTNGTSVDGGSGGRGAWHHKSDSSPYHPAEAGESTETASGGTPGTGGSNNDRGYHGGGGGASAFGAGGNGEYQRAGADGVVGSGGAGAGVNSGDGKYGGTGGPGKIVITYFTKPVHPAE